MRILPLALLYIVVMTIALPVLLVRGCRPQAVPPLELDRAPIVSPAGEIMLQVYRHDLAAMVKMPLEEYLTGVVAAEMPASFHLEALKAQAVVARTYTINQMRRFGGKGCDKHPGADICTDPAHCQAWEKEAAFLAKWPKDEAAAYFNKIRLAVRETAGQVAAYGGKPIDAVFHASCGGHTEDSEKVWSAALPYLRGVPCGYCEQTRWSQTTQQYSGAEFAAALLPYLSAMPVSSAGRPLLAAAERTATGRVLSLRVGNETVSGRDFRSALNLPSTRFYWQVQGENIIFSTRGFGHGVGLCQYGADGQARAGRDYAAIIRHYYTGVEIIAFGE